MNKTGFGSAPLRLPDVPLTSMKELHYDENQYSFRR